MMADESGSAGDEDLHILSCLVFKFGLTLECEFSGGQLIRCDMAGKPITTRASTISWMSTILIFGGTFAMRAVMMRLTSSDSLACLTLS